MHRRWRRSLVSAAHGQHGRIRKQGTTGKGRLGSVHVRDNQQRQRCDGKEREPENRGAKGHHGSTARSPVSPPQAHTNATKATKKKRPTCPHDQSAVPGRRTTAPHHTPSRQASRPRRSSRSGV